MGFISRVVVRLRAVTSSDWAGAAGDRFRKTTQTVSDFSKEHIRPEEIPKEAAKGLRRFLFGRTNREHAQATLRYAETEKSRIQTVRELASLEDYLDQERSKTAQEKIKTRMLETEEMLKRLEFVEKCRQLGAMPLWTREGHMTFIKAPSDVDWSTLLKRLAQDDFATLLTDTKTGSRTG